MNHHPWFWISNHRLSAILSIIITILLIPSSTHTQSLYITQDDSLILPYQLEEIVVYGEKNHAPSMIKEYSGKDIEARNAVNIADVLRLDPDLLVSTGSKGETETRIRGFRNQDILIFIDGRPTNQGYYGKVDLAMLPLENIAKIKIVKGPASVSYGPNSMGGAIHIITKNGFEIPQNAFKSEFGSLGFRNISLNHSNQFSKFNYWISGFENYSNGFPLSNNFTPVDTDLEDGGNRNNSDYNKYGMNVKLGFIPNDRSTYGLSACYYRARRGVPPTVDDTHVKAKFREIPEWKYIGATLSGRWDIDTKTNLKSILFTDSYKDRLIDYSSKEKTEDNIRFDSKLSNYTIGTRLGLTSDLSKRHQFTTWLQYKNDFIHKKPDLDAAWEEYSNHTASITTEDRISIFPSVKLTLGLGYHTFKSVSDSRFFNFLTPMLGWNQTLPNRFNLHISYGRAIRFPTPNHLYSDVSGNKDLRPELADKWEAGLERTFLFNSQYRFLSVELAYFYNDLTDLIDRESKSDPYVNIKNATFHGLAANITWSVGRFLSGNIEYSLLYVKNTSDISLRNISKHTFQGCFTVKTPFGTEIHYQAMAYDKRTTSVPSLYLKDYIIQDLQLSQRIVKYLKILFKLRNLTDTYYEEELGYPGPGREWSAGAIITL